MQKPPFYRTEKEAHECGSQMQEDIEGDGRPTQLGWLSRKLLQVMSGKAWRTSLSMPRFFSYRGLNLHDPLHRLLQGCVIYCTP